VSRCITPFVGRYVEGVEIQGAKEAGEKLIQVAAKLLVEMDQI